MTVNDGKYFGSLPKGNWLCLMEDLLLPARAALVTIDGDKGLGTRKVFITHSQSCIDVKDGMVYLTE